MSRYVLVNLNEVFDSDSDTTGSDEAWEIFYLNDDGQWKQEYMPPLINNDENGCDEQYYKELTAIISFDRDDGEKLLRYLNTETMKQQMENGISEFDVVQGTVILNSLDKILV